MSSCQCGEYENFSGMTKTDKQLVNKSEKNTNEPPHDKTNKMTVRPAKTQISLGIHPVWSVFDVRSMGS